MHLAWRYSTGEKIGFLCLMLLWTYSRMPTCLIRTCCKRGVLDARCLEQFVGRYRSTDPLTPPNPSSFRSFPSSLILLVCGVIMKRISVGKTRKREIFSAARAIKEKINPWGNFTRFGSTPWTGQMGENDFVWMERIDCRNGIVSRVRSNGEGFGELNKEFERKTLINCLLHH